MLHPLFSGKDGLDLIRRLFYDLIFFCDFKGFEIWKGIGNILRKVRNIPLRHKLAIITGYADVKIAVEVIKMVLMIMLPKPLFSQMKSLNLIERALAKKAQEKWGSSLASLSTCNFQSSKNVVIQPYLKGKRKRNLNVFTRKSI